MDYALNARSEMALSRVFANISPETSEKHRANAFDLANLVGIRTTEISMYFVGEPLLLKAHCDGVEECRLLNESAEKAAIDHEEIQAMSGSEEEWNALSQKQQDGQWERFHELCAQGNGDEMYFYRVLMDKWLVGYVGH